jgi:hypothetical protein
MIKLVNKTTEEIYNILSVNENTEVCTVEYQKDYYSEVEPKVIPFWQFIEGYANFIGYTFTGWVETTWPQRIKMLFKDQNKLIYDYPEFLEVIKSDPPNPIFEWIGQEGSIIYVGFTAPMTPEEIALVEGYGGKVEIKE